MDPDRWQRINALLDAVLELPLGQQQAYLDAHCPDDPDLRREVISLLEAHDQARSFLEKPAKDYAATFLNMANDTSADPLLGQVIDGYRILDVLGRGGMGIVYKAEDEALSRTVALKMIDPALAGDASFVRRFRAEAQALARIDSPYIVRVHAMRQSADRLFIVMEYVDGGTVTDLLQRGAVSWPRAFPIIRQMLLALEHAHSVGVIHRDIKPSNVMLSGDGTVKVTDFGLAKLRQTDGAATVTQGIAGTLYYMSPEQVQGLVDLDHRSDLYSMGMTIYQMLAGELPIDRDSGEFAIMRAIVEDTFPPPTQFSAGLPQGVAQAVMKALEKDPSKRYQSAAEMRAAFERIHGGASAADEATLVDGRAPDLEKPPPRRPYLLIGAAAALAVLAVAGYLLWPSSGPTAPTLSVVTTPVDATVYLDGTLLGVTPLSNHEIAGEAESVAVSVRKAGYVTVDTTLRVAAGEALSLDLPLVPATSPATKATVWITSSQPDARVQINGRDAGRTDASGVLSGVEVDPGEVSVELRKSGYKLWRRTYQVAAGATLPVDATLEQEGVPPVATATLTLHVAPAGSISVAGENCRVDVPCTVTAGAKSVTFSAPGYEAKTERLQVSGSVNRTYYFEKEVNVQANPVDGSDVSASIRVNGRTENDWFTPKTITLGPGTYRIEVQKEGYEAEGGAKTVTIVPGFEKTERVVFQIRKL